MKPQNTCSKTDRVESGNREINNYNFADFNTLFSIIDRITRQKISKDIELNNTINQKKNISRIH